MPSFGGSTTSGTESSYRLWDPSKVPSPRKIVAALDKFVVGQEGTKKVTRVIAAPDTIADQIHQRHRSRLVALEAAIKALADLLSIPAVGFIQRIMFL